MVKDAGLSCRYIISKKPEGAPVTERAIPLAIFESEPAVRKHYLRRWLKDNTMTDFDIRKVLDWNYYIERLGGTIMKIITIPAALQSVPNPVPRVRHPDWLHKKIMQKNDPLKQRKINQMFTISAKAKSADVPSPDDVEEEEEDLFANVVSDIEDVGKNSGGRTPLGLKNVAVTHKRKRDDPPPAAAAAAAGDDHLNKSWRQSLGNPPPRSMVREWIAFQKKKWEYQAKQKEASSRGKRAKTNARGGDGDDDDDVGAGFAGGGVIRSGPRATLGGFLRRTQRTLLDTPWQVIQVVETGAKSGLFKVWAMVGSDLHCIKLAVPRIFYVNQRTAKEESAGAALWRKVQKTLPRSHPVLNLYEYRVPEELFRAHASDLVTDLSTPDIEGIYETQVPLDFRVLVDLGCLCAVDKQRARELAKASAADVDTFELGWMQFKTLAHYHYLPERSFRTVYFYHHKVGNKALLGLFVPTSKKASVFVVDTVRSNQMPNLNAMYGSERSAYINKGGTEGKVPEGDYAFEVRVETDLRQVHRQIQRLLTAYREEKRGPTLLVVQSCSDFQVHTLDEIFP